MMQRGRGFTESAPDPPSLRSHHYPHPSASATGTGIVSHAGAVSLLCTAGKSGLTTTLSNNLAAFRKPAWPRQV